MQKRHIGQIDLNTGELLEGYMAFLQPRRLNGFLEWVAMAQGPLIELAVAGLGEQAYRVMLVPMQSIDAQDSQQATTGRRSSLICVLTHSNTSTECSF